MKIIQILLLINLLASNCEKVIPLVDGYAVFQNAEDIDSLYVQEFNENDLLRAEGYYATDLYGNLTPLKKGNWIHYHENGQLKSEGNYKVGEYTHCCAAGPCQQVYSYKYGFWTYYFANGQVKARGEYVQTNLRIDTNCEGGDSFPFGLTSNTWNFYDSLGNELEPSSTELSKYELVKAELGQYYWIPDSTRTAIELIKTGYNKR